MSIYEIHLGSWRRNANNEWLSYRELAEQRVDAGRNDLARLAVDGYAHCITSLSIWPRST